MIHVLTQDRLQVCLVKTGETTPFISSLELLPLNNNTYIRQSGSLIAVSRVFFSPTPVFVRDEDGSNDRPPSRYKNADFKEDLGIDEPQLYKEPMKSREKYPTGWNQRLDGFKKDSKFCIEGSSDPSCEIDLDEDGSVTGFVFKVREVDAFEKYGQKTKDGQKTKCPVKSG